MSAQSSVADYEDALDRLSEKAIAQFEKGPTPRNRLGAAVLLPSMGLLSTKLVNRLPTLAARSLDKEVEKLLYLLNEQFFSEEVAGNCGTLAELQAYFSDFPKPGGFKSTDALGLAYCLEHYSLNASFPPGLQLLEKKMRETYRSAGEIRASYDSNFKSTSDNPAGLVASAFLSLILIATYKHINCAESLTAALKINEDLLRREEEFVDILQISLGMLSFVRTKNLLEALGSG